jgi:hypothetical protein
MGARMGERSLKQDETAAVVVGKKGVWVGGAVAGLLQPARKYTALRESGGNAIMRYRS